jgi:hypothetical protein
MRRAAGDLGSGDDGSVVTEDHIAARRHCPGGRTEPPPERQVLRLLAIGPSLPHFASQAREWPSARMMSRSMAALYVSNDDDAFAVVTDTGHPGGIDDPNRFYVLGFGDSDVPGFARQQIREPRPCASGTGGLPPLRRRAARRAGRWRRPVRRPATPRPRGA